MTNSNCELYIGECNEAIAYKNVDFVYDKDTGNYHLVPENIDLAVVIANDISKKMDELRLVMNNDFKKRLKKPCKMIRIVTPRDTYFEKEGYSYKNAKNIFSYIRVFIENTRYDLTGIRFYKKDKRICCSLKNMQFIKMRINNLLSCDAYPNTLSSNVSNTVIGGEKIEYYNPNVNFDNNDEIIEEFIKFINDDLNDCA